MRIRNLKSEEGRMFNGKKGEVGDFDEAKERWIVNVEERTLTVRPENLELCFSASFPLMQFHFMTSSFHGWTRKKQDGGPVAGELKK